MELQHHCQQELEELIGRCAPLHQARRPGMHPKDRAAETLRDLRPLLEAAGERLAREPAPEDWWLVLRPFLPDMHGAPRLTASVSVGDATLEAIDGCLKPAALLHDCYYTVQVPFAVEAPPDVVRLEVCGYGGQGITFLEVQNRSASLTPEAVLSVAGPVERPEAALRDDSTWAYLGCPSISAAMHDPRIAEEPAVLELGLT